MNVKEHTVG